MGSICAAPRPLRQTTLVFKVNTDNSSEPIQTNTFNVEITYCHNNPPKVKIIEVPARKN